MQETNRKFLDQKVVFDEMNGLPAQSYYEVSSKYWNLIYKQPHNITVGPNMEVSGEHEDQGPKSPTMNAFNRAQSINIAGIDNEFSSSKRNYFQFDFGFANSKAPGGNISQALNQFSAFGP